MLGGYSKSVCVRAQKIPNLRYDFSKTSLTTTPRRHRLANGQLCTVATLAKFLLVWCRLRDVLFRSPCLFEHTLTAVCALPEYQSCRKYNVFCRKCNVYSNIL